MPQAPWGYGWLPSLLCIEAQLEGLPCAIPHPRPPQHISQRAKLPNKLLRHLPVLCGACLGVHWLQVSGQWHQGQHALQRGWLQALSGATVGSKRLSQGFSGICLLSRAWPWSPKYCCLWGWGGAVLPCPTVGCVDMNTEMEEGRRSWSG